MTNLVASINAQKIVFGFRKVDPDSRGQEILESVAKGMSFLPDYAIRVEGHSNLAKSEASLTAEDKARTQKLSEERAEACARVLKAAGAQCEITCVAQGVLKGETKGCVRLVLFQKGTLPQVKGGEPEQAHVQEAVEVDLSQSRNVAAIITPDTYPQSLDTTTPDTTVEGAFVECMQCRGDAVVEEMSSVEQGPQASDLKEETDGPGTLKSPAGIEPSVNPADIEMNVSHAVLKPESSEADPSRADYKEPNKKFTSEDGAIMPSAAISAPAEQWGSTYLPWYIACCAQSKTNECPLRELPVSQMQLLQ